MDIQGTCVISSGFISWSFRCLLGVRLKTMAKFATKLTIPKWISPLESLSGTSHPADLVCSVKNPGAAALGRKGLLFSSTSNTIIQEIIPERCTIFMHSGLAFCPSSGIFFLKLPLLKGDVKLTVVWVLVNCCDVVVKEGTNKKVTPGTNIPHYKGFCGFNHKNQWLKNGFLIRKLISISEFRGYHQHQ